MYEFLKHKFEEWERQRTRKSKGKCIHFFQKAIYVTDIERTDKIEAVTTKGSANFSTVCSTGSPFIVEARNVACLCPNCLFGDPCECPNKHYSGDWIKFNLKTGKKVNDPEFINNHWREHSNKSCVQETDSRSNIDTSLDVTDSDLNVEFTDQNCVTSDRDAEISVTDGDADIEVPVAPVDVFTKMQNCLNFGELRILFSAEDSFDPIEYTLAKLSCKHRIDTDALKYKPKDAPKGFLPVEVYGDGNCFVRALAIAIGMDPEAVHMNLRKHICREGVLNKPRYLDHDYLSYGSTNLPGRSTFPIMYAQFSEYATDFRCIDGETRQDRISRWSRIAENIYEAEVFESRKKNEYMGVWQILQATNCIHRPICSVYPEMFTDAFRAQLNRTFFPFNVAERE